MDDPEDDSNGRVIRDRYMTKRQAWADESFSLGLERVFTIARRAGTPETSTDEDCLRPIPSRLVYTNNRGDAATNTSQYPSPTEIRPGQRSHAGVAQRVSSFESRVKASKHAADSVEEPLWRDMEVAQPALQARHSRRQHTRVGSASISQPRAEHRATTTSRAEHRATTTSRAEHRVTSTSSLSAATRMQASALPTLTSDPAGHTLQSLVDSFVHLTPQEQCDFFTSLVPCVESTHASALAKLLQSARGDMTSLGGTTRDMVTCLPADVSLHIFSMLDIASIGRASRVCKSWYAICSTPLLWRRMALRPTFRLSSAGEQRQLARFLFKGRHERPLSPPYMMPLGVSYASSQPAHTHDQDSLSAESSSDQDHHDALDMLSAHGPDAEFIDMNDPSIDWKAVCRERVRLHRNWRRARCIVRTFHGHAQAVSCLQYRNGRIASGCSDGSIKVWSTRTNAPWSVLTLLGHYEAVRCICLPDDDVVVSGSSDRTIRVWVLEGGQGWARGSCRLTIQAHDDSVRAIHADRHQIVSASYDRTIKIWDMKTGACKQIISNAHDDAVLSIVITDQWVVSGGLDTVIKVWRQDGTCTLELHGHKGGVTCLHYDHGLNRIISGSIDGDIRFWDASTGTCVRVIDWVTGEGHKGVVRCLQANEWRLATASDDRTVKMWDIHTGERITTLRPHSAGVTCLQFDDDVLVSGSFDETVKLLDFSCV